MPAQSKQQQKFMGMVHALKKGEMNPSDASPEVKKAAQSMSSKDAKDFAATKHQGLPRKVKQEILNKLKEYANKMGTNTMGGDDYTSSKKGGLRDNDGYDNVDYNPDIEQEGKLPNNWMQGRTSDYHTQLRGKKRKYDDTNFEKDNSGQPDLEESSPCWDGYKQVGMKTKGGKQVPNCVKESIKESFNELEHLKLLNLALRTMPGSPKQKEIIKKLNKVRVAGGMKPLKEASFHALNNPRFKKATSDLVKNKKIKNPETKKDVSLTTALNDKDHPAHNQAKSLFQRLKSKLVGEYGQRLDLSYLEDEEARLDGTPPPKYAIDRDLNETMIRRAVDIAQELLPKDTWSRYANDGQKNSEFVKNIVRDLTQSLNRFYKNHNISVRIKENQEDSNVDMVLGVLSILRQIDDKENRKRVAVDMIKKFKEQDIDFDYKEFLELMREYKK